MARTRVKRHLVDGLHEFCQIAKAHIGAGVMVEVGSAHGESAEIFAQYFTTVYAVDSWAHPEVSGYGLPEKVEAEFDRRMVEHPNVVKVKALSPGAAELFAWVPIDLVYIDAGHGYNAVSADIEAWLPIAGKLIGGHDYTSYPGVKQAVDERFTDIIVTEDSSWLVRLEGL